MTHFRSEIEELMLCPDNWDDVFPDISKVADTWHKLDWFYCLDFVSFGGDETMVIRASAVNDESVYDRDGIDWREVRDNLKARRNEAICLYNTRAHKLSNITYYRPSYNNKHYVPGGKEATIKRSIKDGDISLFLEDYSSDRIRNGYSQWLINYFNDGSLVEDGFIFNAFDDYVLSNNPDSTLYQHPRAKLWRRILSDHSVRVAFKVAYIIGYQAGVPLEHICFDLEMSSNSLHAYPISKEEADRIMGGPEEVVLNKPANW